MTVACWVFVAAFALQGGSGQVSADALGEAYFFFLEGRTLEAGGDVSGAIEAYRKAIERVPDAADVRAELAVLYARIGQADRSIAEAERALAIEPDNRAAHRILGFVKAAVSEQPAYPAREAMIAAAIEHLQQALAGGVRDLGAELTLGRLHVLNGSYAEGIDVLTAFLLEQPGYPEGMLLLADAHEGRGEPGEAAAVLDSLGWAHFKQGRLDLALEPLERAARALPDTSIIQDHLGDVYFGLKRYREAATAWDRALAGDRDGLDPLVVTAKRDRARELAGGR